MKDFATTFSVIFVLATLAFATVAIAKALNPPAVLDLQPTEIRVLRPYGQVVYLYKTDNGVCLQVMVDQGGTMAQTQQVIPCR